MRSITAFRQGSNRPVANGHGEKRNLFHNHILVCANGIFVWHTYDQKVIGRKDQGPTAYLFKCRHCATLGAYQDNH